MELENLENVATKPSERSTTELVAPPSPRRIKRPCQISYEFLMWTAFVLFAAWAVTDRFVGPMVFNNPHGGFMPPPCFQHSLCLNSPPMPVHNVSLSVMVFDVYQRATGRLFVAVTPFLIMLQCKTTENWFGEHHPSWLKVGDLRTTNNRLHYQMGLFFLTIPMLVHMWIFFVPLMAGVPVRFYAVGEPEPHMPLNPFVDSDGSMFILPADLLRLPLAILTFMILLPLSVGNYCRRRNWNVSHWLHIIAATVYTMDYLRGNHPHAQMWTAPLVIYYIFDRLVGIFWYRTNKATVIHNKRLDDEYAVVFLYAPNQVHRRGTGALYYYQQLGKLGAPRFSHAFTSFQNRSGQPLLPAWNAHTDPASVLHKFFVEEGVEEVGPNNPAGRFAPPKRKLSRQISVKSGHDKVNKDGEQEEAVEDFDVVDTGDRVFFTNWHTAFIMQVHEENRGKDSFTSRVAAMREGEQLRYWGPYFSEYFGLDDFTKLPPLVLMATGAGANYLMDFFMRLTAEEHCFLANQVQVYYSTSSLALFQFVTDFLCARAVPNWAVSAHLTQYEDVFEGGVEGADAQYERQARLGRMSLEDCLAKAPHDAEVYFCGSPDIQWQVELLCAQYHLRCHQGNRFGPTGRNQIKFKGGRLKCSCTAAPCCLHY